MRYVIVLNISLTFTVLRPSALHPAASLASSPAPTKTMIDPSNSVRLATRSRLVLAYCGLAAHVCQVSPAHKAFARPDLGVTDMAVRVEG